MPVLTRRQSWLDLRKSVAESLPKGSFNASETQLHIVGDSMDKTGSDMGFQAHRLVSLPTRQKASAALRLTMQAEMPDSYQSSEDEASPSPDDYSSSNEDSEHSPSASAYVPESDIEDLELEALPITISASALAVAIPMHAVGRPRLINIAMLAPMQKRRLSPSVRPSGSTNSLQTGTTRPVAQPSTHASHYETSRVTYPRTDSLRTPPTRNNTMVPTPFANNASTLSLPYDPAATAVSDNEDEAEMLLRESAEIQSRFISSVIPPTPTSFTHGPYDLFASPSPPRLGRSGLSRSVTMGVLPNGEPKGEKTSGWRGLGKRVMGRKGEKGRDEKKRRGGRDAGREDEEWGT